ncbi:MAG: hypothetical protein DWH79_04635 [Planctomycetota bacterium]|nr:MAG: hypothetical protein DWH79_04635 [Planctomycetota bacterium]
MRDDLIGFVLGSLDDAEAQRVEAALADPQSGPALRRDLEVIRRATLCLASDREAFSAPSGLAGRTLRLIATESAAAGDTAPSSASVSNEAAVSSRADDRPRPSERSDRGDGGRQSPRMTPEASPWGGVSPRVWLDRVIIAATSLAACVLVLPMLAEAWGRGGKTATEQKLSRLGNTLHEYASAHRNYPSPPDGGPISRAGLYAPTLVSERRLVADDGTLLCPNTPLASSGTFRVPSLNELQAAVGTPEFDAMVESMGGDFGYTLGHRDREGRLQPIRPLRRQHHPLMSDAPDESCERSRNHDDGLHHVLFEDGRVMRMKEDGLHREDHLFRNHDGLTAAGIDEDDAVIGDSHHQP